jgi:hypothetical protein
VSSCRVKRLQFNPIIRPEMLPSNAGNNINGPSLIRAPEWLPGRVGQYYLYFAHHRGDHIRLAVADCIEGPWTLYEAGTLHLRQVPACRDHIASPDVHVDNVRREIRMYFHGPYSLGAGQKSFVATSLDGVKFEARDEVLGTYYLRMVPLGTDWIGMARGGVMYRSKDGLTRFERVPAKVFPLNNSESGRPGTVRHIALQASGSLLSVYFTRIGDVPESILKSQLDLSRTEDRWVASHPELILQPETPWEGADLPLRRSRRGMANGRENALRDPAIFIDAGRLFLLYAVAGESGIAIAELEAQDAA